MRAKWNFVLGHDSTKKPRRSGAKVKGLATAVATHD